MLFRSLVKLAGAAYLVVIGLRLVFARRREPDENVQADRPTRALPYRSIYAQGFLTNVLNPKVAVFFLAFVPQFIAVDAPNKALAFIVLGAIFNVNSMLWSQLLIAATVAASRRVRMSDRVLRWLNRLIGGLFVSFGVRLALAESR